MLLSLTGATRRPSTEHTPVSTHYLTGQDSGCKPSTPSFSVPSPRLLELFVTFFQITFLNSYQNTNIHRRATRTAARLPPNQRTETFSAMDSSFNPRTRGQIAGEGHGSPRPHPTRINTPKIPSPPTAQTQTKNRPLRGGQKLDQSAETAAGTRTPPPAHSRSQTVTPSIARQRCTIASWFSPHIVMICSGSRADLGIRRTHICSNWNPSPDSVIASATAEPIEAP